LEKLMGKLWTFGDSWTYGEGVIREHTFSKYLSDELNLECVNNGKSGSTNTMILQSLENHLSEIDKRNDIVLVTLTTPHRDEELLEYPPKTKKLEEITLKVFPKIIQSIHDLLDGYNFKITQAFNPIFGYDYILDRDYDFPNFIEWGKPNNTMIDIITDNWCKDNKLNYFYNWYQEVWWENFEVLKKLPTSMNWIMAKKMVKNDKELSLIFSDEKHPSVSSHQKIAKKLLNYFKKSEKKT